MQILQQAAQIKVASEVNARLDRIVELLKGLNNQSQAIAKLREQFETDFGSEAASEFSAELQQQIAAKVLQAAPELKAFLTSVAEGSGKQSSEVVAILS